MVYIDTFAWINEDIRNLILLFSHFFLSAKWLRFTCVFYAKIFVILQRVPILHISTPPFFVPLILSPQRSATA
jgi:hypothetical protein